MTDMPEDVMQAARECTDRLDDLVPYHIAYAAETIAEDIARAILADRKRRVVVNRERIARAISADLGRQNCYDLPPLDGNLYVDFIEQGHTNLGEVADAVIATLEFTNEPAQNDDALAHPLARFGSSEAAKPGLYRVYWKSGGLSLAAVGMQSNGDRWIAPTNWLRPGMIASAGEWGEIERLEIIEPEAPDPRLAAAEADAERLATLRAQVAEHEATIRRLQDRASKDAETFLERVREAVGVRMASSLRDPAAVLVNHLRGLINVDSVLEYYRARVAEATSSPTPPNTQSPCANGGDDKPGDAR